MAIDLTIRKAVWYILGLASVFVAVVSASFAWSPESLAGTPVMVVSSGMYLFVVFGLIYFLFSEKVPGRLLLVLPLIILGFFLAPFCWVYISKSTGIR